MLSRYLREVGFIAGDVSLLYRHFVDWNLKKIFLWAYAVGVAIFLSIPFVVLVGLIGYTNPDLITNLATLAAGLEVGRPVTEFVDAVAAAALPVAGIVLAGAGIVTAFFLGFAYSLILLARVYLGYIRGERTPIRSLPLASWLLLRQIVAAFAWQGVVLFGFLVAVALWFGVARFALSIGSPLFYGLSGVVAGLALIYAVVRMSFVIGALAEDSSLGGVEIVRRSWRDFAGSSGLLAIAAALPYFAIVIALTAGFDNTGFSSTTLGRVVWFVVFESAEAMIFVSIYSRVRDGRFFAR
jgi:hypothetical protein